MTRRLVLALLLVGAPACKKKGPDLPSGPMGPPLSVDQTLQVSAVSPASVAPGVPTTVQVLGSGFQPGSWVLFGSERAPTVTYLNANVLQVGVPGMNVGTYDVVVQNPDAQQASLRGGLRVQGPTAVPVTVDPARCGLVTVHFDTDQAGLSAQAQATLNGVVDCYTAPGGPVAVLGHADERGTTDYNVALGQRRAEAVVAHLVRAGAPGQRFGITSLGEERPVDPGHNESAWAANRRVELVLR
jgi:peptidoglycan-associated lipoprotein